MKIKELCKRFSSGKSINSDDIKSVGKYPVYGGNGVRGFTDSYNFSGECAIIGRQGEKCVNVRYFCGKAYMTEHAIVLEPNTDNNACYIAYKLSLMNLKQFQGQSAQPGLSVKTLSNINIDLPKLDEQKRIGELLLKIDEEILQNNTINDNLEQVIKSCFDFMFATKKPSGIIGDILCEHAKSTIQVSDSADVSGDFPFFTSGETVNEWKTALVDGMNCYLSTGGNATIKGYYGKAAYSTDTWCVFGKGDYSFYLYSYLKSIIRSINDSFFAGSGLKHLQKDSLVLVKLYIPTEDELRMFNSIVKPAMETMAKLFIETKKLKQQRDFLLPLLMNGQATIAE